MSSPMHFGSLSFPTSPIPIGFFRLIFSTILICSLSIQIRYSQYGFSPLRLTFASCLFPITSLRLPCSSEQNATCQITLDSQLHVTIHYLFSFLVADISSLSKQIILLYDSRTSVTLLTSLALNCLSAYSVISD
jgi:hypothetical protein